MYMIFPIILLLMILCTLAMQRRKKSILKKICSWSVSETLYRHVTKHLCLTMDKLLYLYEYLHLHSAT